MKHKTITIHLRGADARNFMKAVAAERAHANEGSEENRHVPLLIAMEAAQRELLVRLEKAEADKVALVEALEHIAERFLFQSSDFDSITLTKTDDIHIRAVLARVKGDA